MARQRNYREEYRRRLARAEALGLSRKQARGHGGDVPKRLAGPPPVQSSAVYTSEKLVKAYIDRLRRDRRVKLVAVYDDGTTATIYGKKKAASAGGLSDYLDQEQLELLAEKRERYKKAQAGTGNAAHDMGPMRPRPSLLIGYQVIWQ